MTRWRRTIGIPRMRTAPGGVDRFPESAFGHGSNAAFERPLAASRKSARPQSAVILILALLFFAVPAMANTIGVLLSGQGGGYGEVLEALQTDLRRSPTLRIHSAVAAIGGQPPDEFNSAQLVVAVGARAAQIALRNAERVPVLCILIPRATFEALTAGMRATELRRVSAVFLDQPFNRQIELIRQIIPGANRVGVVVGTESSRDTDRLQQMLEVRGMRLTSERITRETELFPALQRVMTDADVFVALPDPRVLNSDTAQNVLLTSYRLRTPVVGYSAAYVRAGALAAIYSTPAQVGTQAAELVRGYFRNTTLPAAQSPKYFSVSINRQVARSLSIDVDEESLVRERIGRAEGE